MPLLFLWFRFSPLNMLGSVRHSSSSLSSHTSSETGNLVILTDSSVGETAEDMYHMQVRLQCTQKQLSEMALSMLGALHLWVYISLCNVPSHTLGSVQWDFCEEPNRENLRLFRKDDRVIHLGLLREEIFCIHTEKAAVQDHSIAFKKWDFSLHVIYLTCSTHMHYCSCLWEADMSPQVLSADQ